MEFDFFTRRQGIETRIDEFLNRVSEAGLIFKGAIVDYLKGDLQTFENKRDRLHETERQGDVLRRELEHMLYTKTLIPESRGDVLELIENMDRLLDHYKSAMWRIDIEQPQICDEFHEDFKELVACGVEAVESTVCACRAFFRNIDTASTHMDKVIYWEKKSDVVSTRLQRAIFRHEELRLSHKRHIRDFVRSMEKIADEAEDVIDRLSIYIIKRAL